MADALRWCAFSTPLGFVRVTEDEGGVTGLQFVPDGAEAPPPTQALYLAKAVSQLRAYFAGENGLFTMPLHPQGTAFQLRVWNALRTIPPGALRTYGDIARAIGQPGAARAVGMACRFNPILIFIPCHRVVGANGALTGFAAGLDRKRALLEREGHSIRAGSVENFPRD